jgi:hypothetical protein
LAQGSGFRRKLEGVTDKCLTWLQAGMLACKRVCDRTRGLCVLAFMEKGGLGPGAELELFKITRTHNKKFSL